MHEAARSTALTPTTDASTIAPSLRARAIRRLAVALVALSVSLGAPVVAAAPTDTGTTPSGRVVAPGLQYLTAGTSTGTGTVASAGGTVVTSLATGTFTAPRNTDFVLDFDGTVDAATRQVVTAAAGIWSAVLDARVPIVVDVRMEAMGPGLLGAAGPTTAHFGRPSFPQRDVLYPVPLANQFAGRDLEPDLSDIELVLSSAMQWDKSVDGDISPAGQSMLSVAVHELGHGLGHTSWVRRSNDRWTVNYSVDGVTVALAYDRLVASSSGKPITAVTGPLEPVLTAPLQWTGAKGRTANGGLRPALYSPTTFELGSSVGHLDEVTFGSGIMTPFLARGESHTTVPALSRAMLADTGWSITPAGSTSTTPTTNPTGSTTSTTQPTTSPSTAAGRADAFVDAVARDFLGRASTDDERAEWRDHLVSGGSRGDVARAFAYSDEWVGVIVDGLYESTLGRGPDPSGRAHWIEVIRAGATPAEVAASFYASDEYYRRSGGTAAAWIRDLYAEILEREADAGGLAFWVGRTVAVPRAAIALDFYQSLESRRDRVAALFDHLLGRAPDAGGWSYWSGILSNGRDVDLAVFLAASDEYFRRSASGHT